MRGGKEMEGKRMKRKKRKKNEKEKVFNLQIIYLKKNF